MSKLVNLLCVALYRRLAAGYQLQMQALSKIVCMQNWKVWLVDIDDALKCD